MVQNSFNSKGYFNGQSAAALKDPSHIHQQKKEEREKEPSSIKVRKRYFQIFLALFLMIATLQGYSQSGISCSLSKNLGSGASYKASESFNMPSGDIWMKYTNPAGAVRISMIPDTVGGANSLKYKEISIYLDSCGGQLLFYATFDTTKQVPFNYLLSQVPVYSNLYIHAKRYINIGCGGCDTANKSFALSLSSNNNLLGISNCITSPCPNNLIENGDFEEHTASTFVGFGADWDTIVCGWSSVYNTPEYYHVDNTISSLDIPSIYTGSLGISTYCHIIEPPSGTSNVWFNGNTNKAIAGLSMDAGGQYDVLEGNLSSNLTASKQYFVSFNAANSGADNYAGEFRINFTDQPYSPSNGADFSNYTDIGLTCAGTAPTSLGQWQTYTAVFSANGGENLFHIGNIDNTANTTSLSQGLITVGTLPEYLFVDNFALVPLAFAGADVTLCAATTAELGACEIPGATYSWSPSTGLSSTTVANPTVTGQGYSIAYTVTVSITIGATTYTDTDVINVINGGTTVTLGASPLVLTTAGTTVLTALPAGMGTYAFYDMANPATILQTTSSNTFTTGSLGASATYGVTLTDANGCTAETTINILYTATPCSTGSPLTHISSNSTSQLTAGPYSGVAFDVSDGFIFDSDVTFTNCEFWMRDGATVNINSTQTVTLDFSLVKQCDKMWNRISNSGTINANNTIFTQGDMAVVMNDGSESIFKDCYFNDNVYGINTLITTPQKTINLFVSGTTFQHLNGFVTDYTLQTTHYLYPATGIQLTNCSNTSIGDDTEASNMFKDLAIGIIANTTNTTITNSFFRDLHLINPTGAVPPGPGSGLPLPYNSTGIAILGKQTQNSTTAYTIFVNPANGQALTTNPTISNAEYKAIVSINIGIEVKDIIIENCNVGIQNEALSALNHVEITNCNINTTFNGINWLGNLSSSNLLAKRNTINVANSTFFNGNGIQISNNGLQTPNSGVYAHAIVDSNLISMNKILRGIRINNSTTTIATHNTIYKDFIGTNFLGIEVSGSDSSNISYNLLDCSAPYTTSNNNGGLNNTAIRLINSNSLSIQCNSTNNHAYGLTFDGNCDLSGTNFKTNEIGLHYVGLFYSASALVGQSLFNGNLWNTSVPTPNAYHARNNNAVATMPACITNSATQYATNEIRTSGGAGVYTTSFPKAANGIVITNPCAPGSYTLDNTGWITTNSGTDSACTENIGVDSLALSLFSMDMLEMRALGELSAVEFNDEVKALADENLYEYLNDKSDLLNQSAVLTTYFDGKIGSNTEKQWLLKKLIADGLHNSYLNNLKENSIQINSIQNTLHSLLKNNADEASIINTKLQLSIYKGIQDSISNIWQSELLSKKILATLANNAIQPNSAIEYNNKQITSIYLSSIYGKDSINLHNDSAAIYQIAKQCPLEGGNSVFWARAMYELLVPFVYFNDDSICNQVVEERRSNNITSYNTLLNKPNTFDVYPNPSDGLFTISSSMDTKISTIELFDFVGNKLDEQRVQKNKTTINYSTFRKGGYLLKITDESNQVTYCKIIIK